ncbi:adenosylcobinamide-GDP ribazoletransferase [Streptomyces sp. BI20]|uniref:adenosylcobinamide-GDP ribazoletransferase n=1 Tax=Streptomyces sp. BI20 TaxID=3403460 RepID=UPI003C7703B4
MTDPSLTPPPVGSAPARASLGDGIRFAFGTLTVLPARITRWDRPAARTGMTCAPLVGLVVGALAAAAGAALFLLGSGPLIAAVAAVAVPALLTRGLHLDGIADTADALGSAKPAAEALRIMKASDIGPFGVITLLFLVLAQVGAVAELLRELGAWGALGAVPAALAGRAALTLASRVGVPAARPGGLGAAVAEVVPVRAALLVAGAAAAVSAALAWPLGPWPAAQAAVAVLLGLAVAERLLRRCVRRFEGVTGDVFGALTETAGTVVLVVLALGH